MKNILKSVKYIFLGLISGPSFMDVIKYIKDLNKFKKQGGSIDILRPFFSDHKKSNGFEDPQYFYQDHIAAKEIVNGGFDNILDVGSRIDGFVSSVAIFQKINVIDIRPAKINIKNIEFIQSDLFNTNLELEQWDCVSCLHTIEHVGLGRYGDPINPYSREEFIKRLFGFVKPGGMLFISTPVSSKTRIEFNAHVVVSPYSMVSSILQNNGKIEKIWVIDDNAKIHENINITEIMPLKYGLIIIKCMKNT